MFPFNSFRRKIDSLLFRLCFFTTVAAAQGTDTSSSIGVRGGMDYFTVLSQRTANTSSEIFARTSFLQSSFHNAGDTITIDLMTSRFYGQYTNSSSLFSLSLRRDVNAVRGSWASGWPFLRYSASLGLSQTDHMRPDISVSMRLQPFGDVGAFELGFVSGAGRVAANLSFVDFAIPNSVDRSEERWNFAVHLVPTAGVKLSMASFQEKTWSHHVQQEYSMDYSSSSSFGRLFSFSAQVRRQWNVSGYFSVEEHRPAFRMLKNDMMFAELPLGTFTVYHARLKAAGELFGCPSIISAGRDEVTLAENGIIQSWPFTSLAGSVIVNRFLFDLNSSIVLNFLTVQIPLAMEGIIVRPGFSYYHIIPEYTLVHWQPQFILFGVTNVSTERSTISRAQLLKAECEVSIPLFNSTITLHAEQYLPISVRYNTTVSQPGGGTRPSQDDGNNRMDGGRFVSIIFSY